MASALPKGSQERKDVPLVRGVLDYFPAALAEVARVSKAGNDKHNPGEDMHHARGKSMDHADCIVRHLADRGAIDPDDGMRHTAKVAWRALALLQEELEAAGAPLARAARLPESDPPLVRWLRSLEEPASDMPDLIHDSGWVDWDGSSFYPPKDVEIAAKAGAEIYIQFRAGMRSRTLFPHQLRWSDTGGMDDIVAYRIQP